MISRRWALQGGRGAAGSGGPRHTEHGRVRRSEAERRIRQPVALPFASVCARPPIFVLVAVTPYCDTFDSCYRDRVMFSYRNYGVSP